MPLEEREEAIKIYKEFEKKYKLPPLKELEEELEVYLLEPIVSGLARTIIDRLAMCGNAIDSVIHPQHHSDMMKSKFFSDEKKKKLWE